MGTALTIMQLSCAVQRPVISIIGFSRLFQPVCESSELRVTLSECLISELDVCTRCVQLSQEYVNLNLEQLKKFNFPMVMNAAEMCHFRKRRRLGDVMACSISMTSVSWAQRDLAK